MLLFVFLYLHTHTLEVVCLFYFAYNTPLKQTRCKSFTERTRFPFCQINKAIFSSVFTPPHLKAMEKNLLIVNKQ